MNKLTVEQLRALAVKKIESLKFAITQSAFTNIRRGLEEELQLAEFALAALDSEPVVVPEHITYISEPTIQNILANDDSSPMANAARLLAHEVRFWRSVPLYRHAQPAPVMPEINRKAIANKVHGECSRMPGATFYNAAEFAIDEVEASLAAMLQDEPVTTANKLPPNSFTDDELEGMAHGNNPQSNAYRELLAYRRNSPVIPDTWIPVSEQMPENDESKPIAIFTGKCLGQGIFVATYDDNGFFDFWEGMEIIGVTHWMPLPAAPQEVK